MTKISDLTALTGAGVDTAADLLPIVDMSLAGSSRNKKITAAELKEAIAPGTAAALDVDIDDTLAADSDSLIPTQQAVKAYVDANVGSPITELDDVPDVNAPTPSNGDVLTWDSTPGEWVAQAPSAGIAELDDVSDVNAPTPSNGDVLTWDSTPGEWIAQAPAGAGAFVLNDATDVDTTGVADGDVLTYDSGGGEWVPAAPSGGSSFRGALVTKAADQTTANYTGAAAIAWDSEAYDTDSIHDNVTNNTRLTVPSGVTKIKLGCGIALSSISSNGIFVRVFKNGSNTFDTAGSGQLMLNNSDSTNARGNFWTPVLSVTAGDYFEINLSVNTDNSITVEAGASWFAMEIIA